MIHYHHAPDSTSVASHASLSGFSKLHLDAPDSDKFSISVISDIALALALASLTELASEPEIEVDAALDEQEVAVESAPEALFVEVNAAPDEPTL